MNAVHQLRVGKPTFANALKLWPRMSDDREHLKLVRVVNGVASLTDGRVLIRRSVMGDRGQTVPDGCYDVRLGGELIPTSNPEWMKYPDIELCRPDGINPASGKPQIQPFSQVTNQALGLMTPIVNDMWKKHHGTAIIDANGIWMRQNPAVGVAYPFNLPQPVELNPFYLEFVLIEMLQYPTVYLLREIRSQDGDDQRTPLIFGLDWANCGLIAPLAGGDED